jgi:hypothetical protein
MPLQSDYLERVYAGFLGKNIGIRLGAPVEPAIWTYQRIREIYGEVTSYLKPYRTFAADDDINGPCYFIRPLVEGDPTRPLEPAHVARAWLDYAREEKGMFWWGGYGVSTEHTAYLNLRAGIPAPESGSIERNGARVAEQIGGQIFIDTWGLVWPGRPDEAARYAAIAASVSHDGDGTNGARSSPPRSPRRSTGLPAECAPWWRPPSPAFRPTRPTPGWPRPSSRSTMRTPATGGPVRNTSSPSGATTATPGSAT